MANVALTNSEERRPDRHHAIASPRHRKSNTHGRERRRQGSSQPEALPPDTTVFKDVSFIQYILWGSSCEYFIVSGTIQ